MGATTLRATGVAFGLIPQPLVTPAPRGTGEQGNRVGAPRAALTPCIRSAQQGVPGEGTPVLGVVLDFWDPERRSAWRCCPGVLLAV